MATPAQAFDPVYRSRDSVFGCSPDRALAELVEQRTLTGLALDLGAGEGRNSFYLARRGFTVDALDVSPRAVRELQVMARRYPLPVTAQQRDIRDLHGLSGPYDLIVADTVLCHLQLAEAREAALQIISLMCPGGWLYASAFATDDPRESEFAPLVQTYFEVAGFCELFREVEHERCGRTSLTDHRHGPPHRHSLLQLAARKPMA
jgi:SAM-dependent methyltransferase